MNMENKVKNHKYTFQKTKMSTLVLLPGWCIMEDSQSESQIL